MPALPPSNTLRYFCDYSVGNVGHTAQVRATAVASPAYIGSLFNNLFTSMGPQLAALTINLVRVALQGSDVTNPIVTGIEGNTYGAGVGSTFHQATSVNFIGRSSTGKRTRFSIFGYDSASSDFRLTTAESTEVSQTVAFLNGAVNAALAIDGTKPTWYPYANVSYNAYWQQELRA